MEVFTGKHIRCLVYKVGSPRILFNNQNAPMDELTHEIEQARFKVDEYIRSKDYIVRHLEVVEVKYKVRATNQQDAVMKFHRGESEPIIDEPNWIGPLGDCLENEYVKIEEMQ
jgi:hypothetical protein